MVVTHKFLKEVPSEVEYSVNRACISHLILVGILSILILFVKNREVGGERGCRQSPKGHSLGKHDFFKSSN